MFANSFLYGSYLSSGTFLKRFPLLIIRRENSVFPYLRSLPVNFSKEGQRAKEGKYFIVCTLPLWKTSEKRTENESYQHYQHLLQILARWVYYGVIFSRKIDRLKQLWNNSQNLKITPPWGKTQKLTISDFSALAFQHSVTAWTLRKIFLIKAQGKVCFRSLMGVIVYLLTVRLLN